MKSSENTKKEGEINNYQYKVHYKVNGQKFYVLLSDPELLLDRIKYEEEFKTYRTRII
jgi:hypothetical protein